VWNKNNIKLITCLLLHLYLINIYNIHNPYTLVKMINFVIFSNIYTVTLYFIIYCIVYSTIYHILYFMIYSISLFIFILHCFYVLFVAYLYIVYYYSFDINVRLFFYFIILCVDTFYEMIGIISIYYFVISLLIYVS